MEAKTAGKANVTKIAGRKRGTQIDRPAGEALNVWRGGEGEEKSVEIEKSKIRDGIVGAKNYSFRRGELNRK